MGIFDGLEKLINEHGSASILRERLELAREQHNSEIGAFKSERDGLISERDRLRTELRNAQTEIQRLQAQVEQLRPKDGLEEMEVSILKLLSQVQKSMTAREIAQRLGG